ncbi:aldehyde dehydrogenase domain-containing protein [Phyllosticta capitalensis]
MALNEIEGAYAWLTNFSKVELAEEEISEDETKKTIVRYTPLGVVVGIVPWNFPISLSAIKIGPSVMTGNTVIIKPSPFTPYCNLKVVELAQQFFPPGVVQVLSGDDHLGPWLTEHPGPAKISFTGSSATGKKVMESAAKTLKRVTLELGGKDPAIVCDDVDVAQIAPKVAELAFLNSGQICLAIKRIYVHEKIYDEFLAAAVEHTKKLRLGNGTEDGVFLGPVQNKMQYERVKGFFSDVEAQKMKVAVGGTNDRNDGYYITPTIIDNPEETSRIATEEPFGPIVPFMKWTDEDDVIARANNTKMGLGASVWSSDLDRAARIARQLESGSVWVNTHLEIDPNAPFGGHKESGVGYELSAGGFKAFCNVQSLFLKK